MSAFEVSFEDVIMIVCSGVISYRSFCGGPGFSSARPWTLNLPYSHEP